ncbi:amino acid permease [Deinococcus ruber]|uniref:Amino acid permease n=1 Tax=Deinococcus ruber TaxID=1848197 RepID=A0A918CJ85_9DEIO|nr:amino acid permease [Deinococcus ruber]GGR25658.1 amino acid permease [Deinococcus ruber]
MSRPEVSDVQGSSAGAAPQTNDERLLASMGYKQELSRRMSGFSNFAISFSIICILAGGITAFPNGFTAAGGASIGIGWPLGVIFAVVVALGMGQIASAFPTAGGLYHWSSILGGRGWGWATAWFNLLGLVFVTASVNVGVYSLFRDLVLGNVFGVDVSKFGLPQQILAVLIITGIQAFCNYRGIRLTTLLTDFSGYLIFVVAALLTAALLIYAPSLDFSRLFTFHNYTGDAGGGVWPATSSLPLAFLGGLILVCYTITGFDASAHTSEETQDAARNVPRGMIQAVLYSSVFGFIMIAAFVLAMPSLDEGAKQGYGLFGWLMGGSRMPGFLKEVLYIGIVIANFLCGLACLTSTSRMIYAFSRDGGLPYSHLLKTVHPQYRTPGPAILIGSVLVFAATLYAPAFAVLAAGSAVLLYISYIMPVAAGLLAEGKSWTHFGPFRLGAWSKPVAVLGILGGAVLAYVGMRPPFQQVAYVVFGLIIALVAVWYAAETRRFQGPPAANFRE